MHERHYHNKPIFEEYFYDTYLEKLHKDLLLKAINSFTRDVVDYTNPNEIVRVIIVLKYLIKGEDYDWNEYRSLTDLMTINKTSYRYFKAVALRRLDDKSNYYYEDAIEQIIFRYRIDKGDGTKPQALMIEGPSKPKPRFDFANYNLPLPNTSDFREFGTIIREDANIYMISAPNNVRLEVTPLKGVNEIKIIRVYEGLNVECASALFMTFLRILLIHELSKE